MIESDNEDIPQLLAMILVVNFSENKVHDAIFQVGLNNEPGPDGFPAEFYQKFWSVLKKDLMDLSFQKGELPFFTKSFEP
jgi:hypothetical protein